MGKCVRADTHTDIHQAAVTDPVGRHLDTQSFETTRSPGGPHTDGCHNRGDVSVN